MTEVATKEDIMRLERNIAELQKFITLRFDDLLHAVWQNQQHRQTQQEWRRAQETAAIAGLAPALWDEPVEERDKQD